MGYLCSSIHLLACIGNPLIEIVAVALIPSGLNYFCYQDTATFLIAIIPCLVDSSSICLSYNYIVLCQIIICLINILSQNSLHVAHLISQRRRYTSLALKFSQTTSCTIFQYICNIIAALNVGRITNSALGLINLLAPDFSMIVHLYLKALRLTSDSYIYPLTNY